MNTNGDFNATLLNMHAIYKHFQYLRMKSVFNRNYAISFASHIFLCFSFEIILFESGKYYFRDLLTGRLKAAKAFDR